MDSNKMKKLAVALSSVAFVGFLPLVTMAWSGDGYKMNRGDYKTTRRDYRMYRGHRGDRDQDNYWYYYDQDSREHRGDRDRDKREHRGDRGEHRGDRGEHRGDRGHRR